MKDKRIVFAGTPDFSAYHLEQLIQSGIKPSLVLTQPDRQAGRGRKIKSSPVKVVAEQHGIEAYQPQRLDEQAKTELFNHPQPDLLIVVAYGLLLPEWTLNWAKYGAINVHASLLPRWRGAAPIQRAIAAGDTQTGVGIMQMDKGLDTGDIWAETTLPIIQTTTAQKLHDELQKIGSNTLINTLPLIFSQSTIPKKQAAEGVTYASKLSKEEAKINWLEDSETICRKIRAYNPYPIAFASTSCNKIFRVFDALPISNQNISNAPVGSVVKEDKIGITVICNHGAICIKEIQETGKKRLTIEQFLNGNSLKGIIFI